MNLGKETSLAAWLDALGLAEYAERFAANDIDLAILAQVTRRDIVELGVAPEHVAIIEAAIQRLAARTAEARPTRDRRPARQDDQGERRHLTVMFCDLVGSTAYAALVDAEDWRALLTEFYQRVDRVMAFFSGHVAQYLGDGVLVYFGWPRALENEAERAVLAGLELLAEIRKPGPASQVWPLEGLSLRIGIHAGLAVMSEGMAYGEVPNVAAKVQAAAEPGSLLITRDVFRQVAGKVRADDLGPCSLGGVPEPLQLFRVLRSSGARHHLGSLRLTPLVGRDAELTALGDHWQLSLRGKGQVVLVSGEPGIGKSRFVEEFRLTLADTPHSWIDWPCSQLLQGTPLHPIVEGGRLRFGGPDVPADRRLSALVEALTSVGLDPKTCVPHFAPALGIPLDDSYPLVDLPPVETRRRQFGILLEWLTAAASQQAHVIAIEDVHWADPSTLEFLKLLVASAPRMGTLVLLTARPEFQPPWPPEMLHAELRLLPLGATDIRRMVEGIAGRDRLSDETVENVARRTSGVPLFVEEVTRLILDGEGRGVYQHIPPSLQGLLTARLDRLGSDRKIAQIGAVLGRDFTYGLIQAISGLPDATLRKGLARLVDSDLMFVQGEPPLSKYRFKHQLIRDIAYESLLKSRRHALHRKAAQCLAGPFAELAESQPEILAIHLTEAGENEAAIVAWQKAGAAALRKSAYPEAIAHLDKGLQLLRALPEGEARDQLELALRIDLGQGLSAVKSWVAAETIGAYERAWELAEKIGTTLQKFRAIVGLYFLSNQLADFDWAERLCQEMHRLASLDANTGYLSIALRFRGSVFLYRGQLRRAIEDLRLGLAFYDPTRHDSLSRAIGYEGTLATRVTYALAQLFRGNLDGARDTIAVALRDADGSTNAVSVGYVLAHNALFHYWLRDFPAAAAAARQAFAYAEANSVRMFALIGRIFAGMAAVQNGQAEGLDDLRQAFDLWQSMKLRLNVASYRGYIAEALLKTGRPEEALVEIGRAQEMLAVSGEMIWAPELKRLEGECRLSLPTPDPAGAEDLFRQAIAMAAGMEADLLELRAASSLAGLLSGQGRIGEAKSRLAPVLARFRPGLRSADLDRARTLLALADR